MQNSEYWKIRFGQLEAAQNQKGVDAYLEIEKIYRQAQKEIEGKISAWYQRFAANNGVSMAEARKMLSGTDLKEFKWDVKDYIKYGQDNALMGGWTKELENASAKFHISRLEALKMHTQHSLEVMYEKQLGIVNGTMTDVLRSGYYHTAYELQKGFGIGWDIAGLDQAHIEKLLSKPWAADGKNFSERIWNNKQKLISEVHSELTRNVMLGQDPQKAIDAIAKKMKTSKHNAGRLVMTEEAYFSSAAQKDCFNALNVEQYEIVATLDSHTSEICQSLDGQVFPMKDYEPGITAPPFHVYCRSTTVPYFEDDFGQIGERVARGEDGKTYYVPADMSYQEWKETFVDGGDKADLIQIPQIQDEKIRKANDEFSQILNNTKSTPFTDKMILYNESTEYQPNEKLDASFAYNQELDVIQYNPLALNYELYDMNFVQAHELSHRMDIMEYRSWENKKFFQAIESTSTKVYDNKEMIAQWFAEGGKYERDMAFSDILSALSAGGLNDILYAGHPARYWLEDRRYTCMEIFANMASIDVLSHDSKAEFSGILKDLYDAYKEIVG